MGKVIIDYEGFKDVLRDYLAEHLIDEIISCMNDNDVFIEDLDEAMLKSSDEKASTAVMTTEEAKREVKKYKNIRNICIDAELAIAMRGARKALKEVKQYGKSRI